MILLFLSCEQKSMKIPNSPTWQLIQKHPNDEKVLRQAFIRFFSKNRLKDAVLLFDLKKNQLEKDTNLTTRIYVATLICIKAGQATDIPEKLNWLRQGMMKFNSLEKEFPNNIQVRVWRATTYSQMPSFLSLENEINQDISKFVNLTSNINYKNISNEVSMIYKAILETTLKYKDSKMLTYTSIIEKRDKYYSSSKIQEQINNIKNKLNEN